MKMKIEKYCTGCGLCHSIVGVDFCKDSKGFLVPTPNSKEQVDFMNCICMASGSYWDGKQDYQVWGTLVEPAFYSYATDDNLRKKASSGGVVSAIAIYLLKNHCVDGIIETKVSDSSPLGTQVVVNYTVNDVLNCCGSRYTISSPLYDFKRLLKQGERYAFIGKPCDVMALRNLQRQGNEESRQISYLVSFVCAGTPSNNAGVKLLNALNTTVETCDSLVYRGNGWPGYAVAKEGDEEKGRLPYSESWGEILGRDVSLSCRFCLDGIGEAADISCGDGWYIKDDKPDFSEHDGRNIVFIRTKAGSKIIKEMFDNGDIVIEHSPSVNEELSIIQNYQFVRRTTMRERILALKIYRRPIPNYSTKMMKKLGKNASVKTRIRILMGTIKRIHDNRI